MENAYVEIDTKKVQQELFDMFLEVRRIIEKYHLRYFAVYGTCLGAVRHKGFIPWDDDLDIAMPDEDYEEFLRIAPSELPTHLELRTPSNPHWVMCYSKVNNKNTTWIEQINLKYPDLHKGVSIDIFPVCGVPSKYKIYSAKWWLYRILDFCSRRPMGDLKVKTIKKRIVKLLNTVLYRPGRVAGDDFFYRCWYRYIFKFKFDQSKYAAIGFGTRPLVFPKSWFDGYEEFPFEDATIRCPIKWHEFLTQGYGNYMELPPEADRVSEHKAAIIDLERPYSYYTGLLSRGEIELQ